VNRNDVLDKLNAGEPKAAITLLKRLLEDHPGDPDLLGLLGIALDETGDIAGARDALERALAQESDVAIRLRNASNLASLLFDAAKRGDAAELLKRGWRWEEAHAPWPNELSCIVRLAQLMERLGLHEQTVALLSPLPNLITPDWQVLKPLVRALAQTGQHDAALAMLETQTSDELVDHEYEALRAHLCWTTGRAKEASVAHRRYLAAVPSFVMPELPAQKYLVGIVQPNPWISDILLPPALQYTSSNYPGMMVRRQNITFRFSSIFIGAGPETIHEFRQMGPQVIINNVVNSEVLSSTDNIKRVNTFLEEFDSPVVNPPEQAAQCTRQRNSASLAGIQGLVVPWVGRYMNDQVHMDQIVAEVEQECSYPIIVRGTTEHEAKNMTLVHSREEFIRVLRERLRKQFYVIQYIGQPRRGKFFRRIRAAFIDGTPLIVRADYSDSWIVRSRNKIPVNLYRDRPDLLEEADSVIQNPEKELTSEAMKTLETIGQLLPLDIFGADFDVDDDGKVLFFEANASMNFYSNAPKEFPYPRQAEAVLCKRIEAALDKRGMT